MGERKRCDALAGDVVVGVGMMLLCCCKHTVNKEKCTKMLQLTWRAISIATLIRSSPQLQLADCPCNKS